MHFLKRLWWRLVFRFILWRMTRREVWHLLKEWREFPGIMRFEILYHYCLKCRHLDDYLELVEDLKEEFDYEVKKMAALSLIFAVASGAGRHLLPQGDWTHPERGRIVYLRTVIATIPCLRNEVNNLIGLLSPPLTPDEVRVFALPTSGD